MTDLFYVVEAIACGTESWRVRGVFSREADANALVASINKDPAFISRSAVVELMSYETLEECIVKDRLARATGLAA